MSSSEESGNKAAQDDKTLSKNPAKRDVGRELKSIKNKLLRKEKGSTQSRFVGDGVIFKAKLIGVEEIDEARGDKLCQETLQRLKQVVKTSGTHKQRISLSVSLSGVKLLEEKTGVLLYHHPVHQISFISQDIADDRAFGYICSPTTSIFHFVAIKTEKSASLIVLTLRDLFQVVLDIKKKHKLKQQQAKDEENENFKETTSVSSAQSKSDTSSEKQQAVEPCEEAIYAEVGQFLPTGAGAGATQEGQAANTVNEDVLKTANDLLCGDLLDLNFEETQPISSEAIFLDKPILFQSVSETVEPKESETTAKTEAIEPPVDVSKPQPPPPPPEVDKYAVFEEIDRVTTSIFENPPFNQLNTSFEQRVASPPAVSRDSPLIGGAKFESSFSSSEMNNSFETDFANASFPPSMAVPPCLFADLDPLAADRPFIDKKVFFNEIKNPPRKNLKDLMTRNNTIDGGSGATSIIAPNSPPPPVVSIFSNRDRDVVLPPPNYPPPVCANPFVIGGDNNNVVCSSPPRVPPRVPTFDVFCRDNQTLPHQTKVGNPFNATEVEIPPPNTPPPVLGAAPASTTTTSVFSTDKSPVLPKINDSDGAFFPSSVVSPPIAVSNSKIATQILRSSGASSIETTTTGAYSSSWSVSSKFNTEDTTTKSGGGDRGEKLGSDKFYSNDEIAFTEEETHQSPASSSSSMGLRKTFQRSNWNTFEIDDTPTPTPTPSSELRRQKVVHDVFDKTDTATATAPPSIPVPQLGSSSSLAAVQTNTKMPCKEAQSFGSQIFGTSSSASSTSVEVTNEKPEAVVMSPEELSIFKRKQDPFADDFFLSLAK